MIRTHISSFCLGGLAVTAALLAPGCSSVPRGTHEETRQQIVALRAELLQSQNQLAKLKTQNRDVVTRAVEDARRIAALETANERLEQSVVAYQAERDEYARTLREIKQEVLASTSRPQASLPTSGIDLFLTDHPELEKQTGPGWIALRTIDLFTSAESDEISPRGVSILNDLAERVEETPSLLRTGESRDDSVRTTSHEAPLPLAERRSQRIERELGGLRTISSGEKWVRILFAESSSVVPRS